MFALVGASGCASSGQVDRLTHQVEWMRTNMRDRDKTEEAQAAHIKRLEDQMRVQRHKQEQLGVAVEFGAVVLGGLVVWEAYQASETCKKK